MVLKNSDSAGYYVTQRQWTPTKPRAPISADFQTPGPGSFNIPSTIGKNANQVVKGNSPSFTFGSKLEEKPSKIVPGPGSYNIAGLSEKGRDTCNAATIAPKLKEPEPFKTPAPGAYNPDKSDGFTHIASPRYTFGSKFKEHAPDDIPGPAYYEPERADSARYSRTPGFTIRGRSHSPPHDAYPSPAEYAPERADVLRYASPPRYTFGSRLRDHDENDPDYSPPGPNTYRIERADSLRFRSPPRWSFRCSQPVERVPDIPSPNSYRVESCDRQRYPSPPKYSIRGSRNSSQPPYSDRERDAQPGPGHYEPNVYGTIPRAANIANKLEPPQSNRPHTRRYLKRTDSELPPRFRFIDDPIEEPVKKKRSEQKRSWFPSFASIPRKATKAKKSSPAAAADLRDAEKNAAKDDRRPKDTKAAAENTNPTTENSVNSTPKVKAARATLRSSWMSPLKLRQKKNENSFSSQDKTQNSSEHPQNPSSTAAQPSTLTSRPLSWAERSFDGRTRESRPLERDHRGKGIRSNNNNNNNNNNNKGTGTKGGSGGGAGRSLLRRSLSFGARDSTAASGRRSEYATDTTGRAATATSASGDLLISNSASGNASASSGTLGRARRGRSAESLRTMPPRFESYTSPTKSFAQKMTHACSIGGGFEHWPSLRRIRDTTPAPGEYHIERADALVRPLSPAYSFGSRRADSRPRSTTPAPCDYLPDRADHMVFTNAPAYSFRSKTADPEVIFNERFFNAPFSP